MLNLVYINIKYILYIHRYTTSKITVINVTLRITNLILSFPGGHSTPNGKSHIIIYLCMSYSQGRESSAQTPLSATLSFRGYPLSSSGHHI